MESIRNGLYNASLAIDNFLGAMDHFQIVATSYIVATLVLLGLFLYLIFDSKRQKKKLAALQASGLDRRNHKTDQHGS